MHNEQVPTQIRDLKKTWLTMINIIIITLMESNKKLTKFLQIVQNPNLNIAKGIANI